MELVEKKYIPVKYNELPNGLNVIEAHQGSGKTERINDLIGQRTLVIGHRRELGIQIIDRCEGMNFGYYEELSRKQLHTWENLFICYPSLMTLTGRNFEDNGFDNLVIDEANEVWANIVKFLPNKANYKELEDVFRYIPRKIVIGAYFPEYVLNDLDRLSLC
jgi:hypothetical protein